MPRRDRTDTPYSRLAGSPIRWGIVVCLAALLGTCSGCLVVQVGVTNPLRGVNTVAVVPFFNQSDERAVDGRRLAMLYATELQKTPGVEVIPVGVTELAMRKYRLENLSGPHDAARLAVMLNADAVVIGSVTEYSPYNPPRIGLSLAWYSPYGVQFDPGVAVDPGARRRIHEELMQRRKAEFDYHKDRMIRTVEGHLDDFFLFQPVPPGEEIPASQEPAGPEKKTTAPLPSPPAAPAADSSDDAAAFRASKKHFRPPLIIRGQSSLDATPQHLAPERLMMSSLRPVQAVASPVGPLRPLMTYTKVFDAADSATSAAFRDFLELQGDPRGGSWSARLQWADEFPRFAMHMMIVEMFQLHGGQARRRVILKWRKHK